MDERDCSRDRPTRLCLVLLRLLPRTLRGTRMKDDAFPNGIWVSRMLKYKPESLSLAAGCMWSGLLLLEAQIKEKLRCNRMADWARQVGRFGLSSSALLHFEVFRVLRCSEMSPLIYPTDCFPQRNRMYQNQDQRGLPRVFCGRRRNRQDGRDMGSISPSRDVAKWHFPGMEWFSAFWYWRTATSKSGSQGTPGRLAVRWVD